MKQFLTACLLLTLLHAQSAEDIRGWGEFPLGMSFSNCLQVLENEYPWMPLNSRSQSDIASEINQMSIEVAPTRYLESVHFQFYSNQLYYTRVIYRPEYYAYLELYASLTNNYGEATTKGFSQKTWSNENYLLILDRPLTVKYIDKSYLDKAISNYKPQNTELREKLSDNL